MTGRYELPIRPNPEELRDLSALVQPWLSMYGEYVTEEADTVTDFYEGLAVRLHPAFFAARFPGEVVRAVLPVAAGALAVGSYVELAFKPAHFQDVEDSIEYQASSIEFRIECQKTPDGKIWETLYIDGPDAKLPYGTSRQTDYAELPSPINDALLNISGGVGIAHFAELMASDQLSEQEFDALFAIALNLDQLQAATQGPPSHET